MDEKRHEGRYDRQTMLPEIGPEGQERLRRARVLIVGAGGLGSPVSLYLAGAGVGRIGLVDDDRVGRSNLHRQVLYAEDEVGHPKALAAARRLRALNPDVEVEPHVCRLSAGNVRDLVGRYDVVVDACDNYATRYLLSDACVALGRPYVYGAVEGFCGQVAVFCRTAGSRTYRDLYPEEDAAARQALEWFTLKRKAVQGNTEDGFIYVKSEYKLIQIRLDDILYIEGLKDYLKIYVENENRPILTLTSMKNMEEKLPRSRFMRVHRSYIVQMNKVKTLDKGQIIFGKVRIPISDTYKNDILEYLNRHTL